MRLCEGARDSELESVKITLFESLSEFEFEPVLFLLCLRRRCFLPLRSISGELVVVVWPPELKPSSLAESIDLVCLSINSLESPINISYIPSHWLSSTDRTACIWTAWKKFKDRDSTFRCRSAGLPAGTLFDFEKKNYDMNLRFMMFRCNWVTVEKINSNITIIFPVRTESSNWVKIRLWFELVNQAFGLLIGFDACSN